MMLDVTEYHADVYYNSKTGERVHAAFSSYACRLYKCQRAETAVMCMYVQHLMEKLFILHAVYQEEMGNTPEKG